MRKIVPAVLIVVLMTVSAATAFDGQRRGLVMGGGLGIAPAITVKADFTGTLPGGTQFSLYGVQDTRAGIGGHAFIGYAWDNNNMIVFEGNGAAFRDDNVNISQSFSGVSWYHYFGRIGHSGFTAFGLGAYGFDTDETDRADYGGGMLLGGGYEFAPHFQIGGFLSFGKTSVGDSNPRLEFKHSTFSVLLSGVVF